MDGVGTVLGRPRGAGPHLLVGSTIEGQNEAGWLDGALGVVAGIALARAGLPVDVCAFADEEGGQPVVILTCFNMDGSGLFSSKVL